MTLPSGGNVAQTAAYTGYRGSTGSDFDYRVENGAHVFETTRPLQRREGLTVAVGFEKGAVDPPSKTDKWTEWWTINASMIVLLLAMGAL
ncbi:DUF2207 domain-containing protein, partial [Enterococcus hirae]